MRSMAEWEAYLTERIQHMVNQPSMFGRETELTMVTLLEAWQFAIGAEPSALERWQRVCGEVGTGAFYMRDWLESPYGKDWGGTVQHHQVESFLGEHMAKFARGFGLKVTDPPSSAG